MLVYRITKTKYANELVASGFRNRWNEDGQFVIYTSDSRSLACLENLVHRSNSGNDQLFRTMIISIPDDIPILTIQEKEIHPIGGAAKDIDVQVIAATNKDLVGLCETGDYRWDLYYRLAVAEIGVPPLRDRGENEIEQMLKYLVEMKKREMRSNQTLAFERAAWDKLIKYHYPGNVREMENIVESLYVFNEQKVKQIDLPERIQKTSGTVFLLSEVERQHILKVSEIFGGQKMKAAEALGISYNTFKKKMNEIEQKK